MRLLTTAEVADYLRIKERKVYEMVSEAAIPCTKVMGKWLFPKDQIDRWLLENLVRPDGMTPADPMPIVGGSHDPLLEWALRESLSGLATLPEGSEAGLRRFVAGELVAAAIHLHALDDDALDANVEAMKVEATLYDAVLIGFARREVGLLTAPGNPLGLRDLHDVAGGGRGWRCAPTAPARNCCCCRCCTARKFPAIALTLSPPPVRPGPTSRRPSAPGAPTAALRSAPWPMPPVSTSSRSCGSGSISSCGNGTISGRNFKRSCGFS